MSAHVQDTPIGISRALELFVKDLIDGAAAQADARGATTLQPVHLKAAVAADHGGIEGQAECGPERAMISGRFDTLKPLVAGAPDPPTLQAGQVARVVGSKGAAGASRTARAARGLSAAGRGRGRARAAGTKRGGRAGGGEPAPKRPKAAPAAEPAMQAKAADLPTDVISGKLAVAAPLRGPLLGRLLGKRRVARLASEEEGAEDEDYDALDDD